MTLSDRLRDRARGIRETAARFGWNKTVALPTDCEDLDEAAARIEALEKRIALAERLAEEVRHHHKLMGCEGTLMDALRAFRNSADTAPLPESGQ